MVDGNAEDCSQVPKIWEFEATTWLVFRWPQIAQVQGKVTKRTIPFNAKHPILLPADHHLTVLIIDNCHQRTLHNSVKETLTKLRSRFWVNKGRQIVWRVIPKCVNCKKIEAKHYVIPPAATWPQFRVEENPTLANTGIDFAGPLFVTSGEGKEQSNFRRSTLLCFPVEVPGPSILK